MGIIFPIYAGFFVEWIPGMKIWFIVGSLLAGVIVGVSNYYLMKGLILSRLIGVSNVMNNITSSHDLTLRVDLNSQDQLGQMARNFNQLTNSTRIIIEHIHSAYDTIYNSSQEIESSLKSSGTLMEGVVRESMQQAEALQLSSSILATLDVQSKATITETRQVNNQIHDIREQINIGNESVAKAIKAIGLLEASGRKRMDIINAITEVANGTNLLSLNAAIEAAKAGVHGRGFSVVADEVRELAGESLHATGEINELLTDDMTYIQEGVSTIQKAGEILQDNVALIRDLSHFFDSVERKVNEQQNVIHQIRETLGQLTETSSNNSQVSQKVFDTMQNLTKLSVDVSESTDELYGQISKFKVKFDEIH